MKCIPLHGIRAWLFIYLFIYFSLPKWAVFTQVSEWRLATEGFPNEQSESEKITHLKYPPHAIVNPGRVAARWSTYP